MVVVGGGGGWCNMGAGGGWVAWNLGSCPLHYTTLTTRKHYNTILYTTLHYTNTGVSELLGILKAVAVFNVGFHV